MEHGFVTNEAPFRFPELILVPFESQKEIYNFILVPARQRSKGVVFLANYFLGTFL